MGRSSSRSGNSLTTAHEITDEHAELREGKVDRAKADRSSHGEAHPPARERLEAGIAGVWPPVTYAVALFITAACSSHGTVRSMSFGPGREARSIEQVVMRARAEGVAPAANPDRRRAGGHRT